jgi:hypothetical protein
MKRQTLALREGRVTQRFFASLLWGAWIARRRE